MCRMMRYMHNIDTIQSVSRRNSVVAIKGEDRSVNIEANRHQRQSFR